MPSLPQVCVIVLNWKNFPDTKNCLDSLEQSTYPNLRIIVVDNCSNDNSVERLRKEYPHLPLIVNNQNLGFARGCNVGIRQALRDRQCAYVLLLNNDAVVCKDSLLEAIEFAESDGRIGVISGKILLFEVDRGQYETPCEVGFATGALMLIKREVLERVGLLPEEYFFGIEEWDYSFNVRRSGYRLCYVPKFVAYHKADGSHWNYDPKFVYNSYRNKLIFQEKYLPWGLFPLWKAVFGFYGRHLARRARQKLIERHQYNKHREIPLDHLDFALARALDDHGKNALSEETLLSFHEELLEHEALKT